MIGSERHWLKPLAGGSTATTHALLWVEKVRRGNRVVAGCTRLWPVAHNGTQLEYYAPAMIGSSDDLDAALDTGVPKQGKLTIWLADGWEDLVLSHLTALMDAGAIQHSYVMLDGSRVLIRGTWRSRSIVVTSFGNWLGAGWRTAVDWSGEKRWFEMTKEAVRETVKQQAAITGEETTALLSLSTILATGYVLGIGAVGPTVGSTALRVWRAWMGPRVLIEASPANKRKKHKALPRRQFVAPLPTRPESAVNAERHCCYALETRQFGAGHVKGPIYAVDLREAYLWGLVTSPMPVAYVSTHQNVDPETLAKKLDGHVACALVRINNDQLPFPARIGGRTRYCTGNYYTWLAGCDLAQALCTGCAAEVYTAHLWSAATMTQEAEQAAMLLSSKGIEENGRPFGVLWRRIYSAMVGRFAGWRKEWRPVNVEHAFGPWAAWIGADKSTGRTVPYRSIAGRAEMLADRSDTSDAVPLLYACVTARVRHLMQILMLRAGLANVLAIHCDELWLTAAGLDNLNAAARMDGPSTAQVRTKAVFDHVWLSGDARAAVEIAGKRHMVCPGVPRDVPVDESGKVGWEATDPWNTGRAPDARKGVGKIMNHVSVSQFIRLCAGPLRALPRADKLHHLGLPEELLLPLGGRERVEDES